MPKLVLPVPDTNESVVRPIVFDITRQLFKATGIPDNTKIAYLGILDRAAQPGSTIDSSSIISNTTPFQERITVDVDENYSLDRILSTAVYRPEHQFIFRDDDLGVYLRPAYSNTDCTINIKYRAADETTAIRWRDDIRTRVSMGREVMLNDITYHYLIPQEFLVILNEIHRLRELNDGYGEEWEPYFQANSTTRLTLLSTMSGNHKVWAIREKQMRIVGYFDFDGFPEKGSKEDEGDTWTIGFSYKFKYDKPIECVMAYPLIIHNQLLGPRFRPNKTFDTPEQHLRSYSLSIQQLGNFESGRKISTNIPGVSIPSYDDFFPGTILPNTIRVFTSLVTLDPINPTELFNLRAFSSAHALDQVIIDFLIGEVAFLTKPLYSIFALSLYAGIHLQPNNSLVVDSDLDIAAAEALSLRNYYHVRLALVTDFSLLDADALIRLRNHGRALQLIIDAVDPTVRARGLMPPILGNDYVRKEDLDAAIRHMRRVPLSEGNHQEYQFNTVQFLIINAKKESELYASS